MGAGAGLLVSGTRRGGGIAFRVSAGAYIRGPAVFVALGSSSLK